MREEGEEAANRAASKLQVRSSPLTRGELTPSSLPPPSHTPSFSPVEKLGPTQCSGRMDLPRPPEVGVLRR